MFVISRLHYWCRIDLLPMPCKHTHTKWCVNGSDRPWLIYLHISKCMYSNKRGQLRYKNVFFNSAFKNILAPTLSLSSRPKSEHLPENRRLKAETNLPRHLVSLTRFYKIAVQNYKFQMASGQGSHWFIESPTTLPCMYSRPLSDI